MARRAYPIDLSDARWASIEPIAGLASQASLPVGLREGYDLREIVNALFYQNRTGCQWALRPHNLPRCDRAWG